jgi:hypothetical protein
MHAYKHTLTRTHEFHRNQQGRTALNLSEIKHRIKTTAVITKWLESNHKERMHMLTEAGMDATILLQQTVSNTPQGTLDRQLSGGGSIAEEGGVPLEAGEEPSVGMSVAAAGEQDSGYSRIDQSKRCSIFVWFICVCVC